MSQQKTIIIAGMHRSGTSLTASLLQKSGLDIGNDLMSNGFDNAKGHFEDLEFLKIHEEDLMAKSLDTRGLSGNIKSHLNFEQQTVFNIRRLLESKRNLPLWGWKEPRTTLYLRAWKKVLPDVKCIAVFRHYDEVVNSLVRRYKYKLNQGVGMGALVRIKHYIMYPVHIQYIKYNSYKSWYLYNKGILDFKAEFPDDVVLVELNHFTSHYNPIVKTINAQFNTDLSSIEVEKVIDRSMLNVNSKQQFKPHFFSNTKLQDLMILLRKNSVWI